MLFKHLFALMPITVLVAFTNVLFSSSLSLIHYYYYSFIPSVEHMHTQSLLVIMRCFDKRKMIFLLGNLLILMISWNNSIKISRDTCDLENSILLINEVHFLPLFIFTSISNYTHGLKCSNWLENQLVKLTWWTHYL